MLDFIPWPIVRARGHVPAMRHPRGLNASQRGEREPSACGIGQRRMWIFATMFGPALLIRRFRYIGDADDRQEMTPPIARRPFDRLPFGQTYQRSTDRRKN